MAPHEPRNDQQSSGVTETSPVELVTGAINDAREAISETRAELLARLNATMDEVKPKLRGWFHLVSIPIAVVGGLALLVFTPTLEARAAVAVFVFASILLFSVSATYHRSNGWVGPRTQAFLQKTDHASITVLIAGTNTPFAMLLMDGGKKWTLLLVVWGLTILGVATKYVLAHPPRWINVPLYLGLGWLPIFFIGDLYRGAQALGPTLGLWVFILIALGGLLYTIGGVLFAWRPTWLELRKGVLGYHEAFHFFTVLAFLSHYAAVSLVAYSVV